MIREGGAESAPHPFSDEELAWAREHLTQLRQSVSGQGIVLQSLGIGFVLGLAAHVGGYALKASATTEPFQLVADLLYALGWALWTGVVVALFVEIIPKAKQRQITQALDAYEAALHEKARSGSAQTSKGDA
jgi:predicted lysophospholipase L1 biosynthesis ABC-type transport system permease subunit